MYDLANESALTAAEQIQEQAKKRDTDLQDAFQRGKQEGEHAEKEKNLKERKEAEQMHDANVRTIRQKYIQDRQVRLSRAFFFVSETR